MAKSLSLAEAKTALSECIREVERGNSVVITRRGKAVAALVRAEDFKQLDRLRAAGPVGGLARVAGGWKGSEELVRVVSSSRRVGRRKVTRLD